MTTVCYRDGILASDSRATAAGWIVSDKTPKIIQRDDGTIITGTGDWEIVAQFMRMFPEKVDVKDNRAIVAHPDGRIEVFEGQGSFVLDECEDFMAWGSGMPPALAAMHMGASAERAIEIAALVDPGTGGPVVSFKIGPKLAVVAA